MQIGSSGGNSPPLAPGALAPAGREVGSPDAERAPALQTGSIRIPLKRRRLRGIVVGTLAGCTLILIAAVIARVSHASSEPPPVAVSWSKATAPAAGQPDTQAQGTPAAPAAAAPAPTTGTLRLQRPASAGPAWLDGKKLAQSSIDVACGTHQLKLGTHGHPRSIQVPCGAALDVSK